MGSDPCREIQLPGITHLVVGKTFQVPEVRQATKFIRGLSGGVEARLGLIFASCKSWVENTFLYCVRNMEL